MKINNDLRRILIFSVIFFIFHFTALGLHLYWIVPWSDIISHLLGGLIVSLLFWQFIFRSGPALIKDNPRFFTLVLAVVLGALWEIFEVIFGISISGAKSYWGSTFIDILSSIFGAFFGFYYYIKKNRE